VLGEFAWKVEDMLNRVLDNTIQPHEGVQAVVRHAIDALPQLLAALKGDGTPTAPLSAIMQAAEQVASGQTRESKITVGGDGNRASRGASTRAASRSRRCHSGSQPDRSYRGAAGGEAGVEPSECRGPCR
jgi:chemotaxis protein histidine kinase CheA